MKTFSLALAGALLLQVSASAAPQTHEIDPAHTSIGFRIQHLYSFVTGRFNDVKGEIVVDPDKPEEGSVNVILGVDSIDTGVEARDKHLKNADFFDTDKFKEITFKSKSVKKTGEKTADVTGDLTIRDVTKEVVLKAELLGHGKGMKDGEERSGWKAATTIKRSDFGITYGTPLVGDEVEILLDIEAIKKP